jgi:lactoylglutathione lyase
MKTAFVLALFGAFGLGFVFNGQLINQTNDKQKPLTLGAFSVSLNVKDLEKSKNFYEKLGFHQSGGDLKQNYVIMKNGNTLIGLFQGMFEQTMLTFNPGWDQNKKSLKKFDDVRVIQKHLKSKGVTMIQEASDTTTGPAYILFADPDGNVILIDQHR